MKNSLNNFHNFFPFKVEERHDAESEHSCLRLPQGVEQDDGGNHQADDSGKCVDQLSDPEDERQKPRIGFGK